MSEYISPAVVTDKPVNSTFPPDAVSVVVPRNSPAPGLLKISNVT